MKICKFCLIEKPFDEFQKNGKSAKGNIKYKPFCKSCDSSNRVVQVAERREIIANTFGKSCKICGYDRCWSALEFHHLDSSTKDFDPSHAIHNNSTVETLLRELKKCIMVCANCHREIHAGIIQV